MRAQDFHIMNHDKLDRLLVELCQEVVNGQKQDPEYYGMVAAGVLDPNNNFVKTCNIPQDEDHRIHAERAAIDKYIKQHGNIPEGSIILTTCSPCSDAMDERYGSSCTDYINSSGVHKVYCGYMDPTQGHSEEFKHKQFSLQATRNKKIQELCQEFAATFLEESVPIVNYGIGASPGKLVRVGKNGRVPHAKLHVNVSKKMAKKLGIPHAVEENFADGKGPGRAGDSQRHGIPKGASMAQLEKAAKAPGRKGQLARWQINMRRGHKK
jgi:pyrimidine deaminase RibD-like protein